MKTKNVNGNRFETQSNLHHHILAQADSRLELLETVQEMVKLEVERVMKEYNMADKGF